MLSFWFCSMLSTPFFVSERKPSVLKLTSPENANFVDSSVYVSRLNDLIVPNSGCWLNETEL